MSMSNLNRRIDRLLEEIEQRQPRERPGATFKMHLFTSGEQERLQAFLDRLALKPEIPDIERIPFEQLSEEEFEAYGYWLYLQYALEQEDITSAQKWRRRLSMTRDQVLTRFLALDISFLPTGINEQGPHVVEDKCIYCMDLSYYRNLLINRIERGRITRDTVDDMWRWIDFVESRPIAA